jgi:hypothetical protein
MAGRKARPDPETISMFSVEDAKEAQRAEQRKTRATDKFKDSLLPITPRRREAIDRLFAHWKRVYEYKRAKLGEVRERAINARLYHGFSEEELMLVLDFVKDLPFWRGQNDRNKPFDDIAILFGSNQRTEKLLVQARAGRKDVDRRATDMAASDAPLKTERF